VALAARYRVFAFDLRGHGGSEWPGEYSLRLMRDDVIAALGEPGRGGVTLIGHSMGGAVGYLITMARPDLVTRLIAEDACPPFPRDRAIPDRPQGELAFDWRAAEAIISEVNRGDPEAWAALPAIRVPTLIVGGGPDSHIPGAKLSEAAALIPRCDLVTINAGHSVHATRADEFARVVLSWLADHDPDRS
jgi:pimeloyl-ACP methyl ester carboxylesterase